jgi:hypothetical protein
MKSIRLAALGLIAAVGVVGAVSASAAPAPKSDVPELNSSLVAPVYYCCWWKYGRKYCSYNCGGKRYYRYRY